MDNQLGTPKKRAVLNSDLGVVAQLMHLVRRGFGCIDRNILRGEDLRIGLLKPISPAGSVAYYLVIERAQN